MEKLKQIFGGDTRQFGMIFALVALIVLFQILTDGLTLKPENVINIFQGNSYILVMAIGMVLVIIAGHIDLSVGSVAAFAGIVVAIAMRDWGIPWWLGIVLGLVIGAIVGAWQGFWVSVVGIPAFIVTLAGMLIFRGANQAVGHSNTVPVPNDFQVIGAGYLPEVGPDTGYNNLTLLLGILLCAAIIVGMVRNRRNQRKIGIEVQTGWFVWVRPALICVAILAASMLMASGRKGTSLPVSALILGVLVLLYGFISTRTIVGRHVYAVGGNRHAAELSGVRSRRINFLVMMNMSILAALGGMMFVARSNASGPFDGVGWELDVIAAVFIGGAAVSGGVGTVVGSVIGGLVMAVLNNGLQLLGVGADQTQIYKGLVLLAAVAFDVYNKSQGRRSITGMLMKNFGGRATEGTGEKAGQEA
ncbi:multiple monosaccharide ABC transporter permease [Phycicoccus sp. M110.8]|uniref:multiple monosaccharide ABC transporter permease n=1 Tax=Phycicoccus sp. M110.8 TaxID=3075433 RepID=UPI0028FD2107|nr:multiple monosaccharide ABC transporter permease [Phycicoccus sp. M110.8]MDU0313529.1 multiple monosaccharide ABC transporter permease [Phycicoccus sp. M110.8]HET8766354.1 multiple monosaccharide ABC transporter permease [Pedococcus sp.]